jgi:hypothetical protein
VYLLLVVRRAGLAVALGEVLDAGDRTPSSTDIAADEDASDTTRCTPMLPIAPLKLVIGNDMPGAAGILATSVVVDDGTRKIICNHEWNEEVICSKRDSRNKIASL